MMRWLPVVLAGLSFGPMAGLCAAEVGLIKVKGVIGPATASYISRAINLAGERKLSCLIIQLDTPGGALDATKDIVQRFYASTVPTVVYVSPAVLNTVTVRDPSIAFHGYSPAVDHDLRVTAVKVALGLDVTIFDAKAELSISPGSESSSFSFSPAAQHEVTVIVIVSF